MANKKVISYVGKITEITDPYYGYSFTSLVNLDGCPARRDPICKEAMSFLEGAETKLSVRLETLTNAGVSVGTVLALDTTFEDWKVSYTINEEPDGSLTNFEYMKLGVHDILMAMKGQMGKNAILTFEIGCDDE